MSEQWMSIAEAAAAMRVHPRTVERRVAANKIESRRNDDGQIEILVNVPDVEEPVSTHALDTVRDLADRQVDLAAGTASALVRVAQEQTLRTENQLMLARQDAGRYRRESQWSLGFVAVMLVLLIGAVGWCAHAITLSRADARQASDRAAQAAELATLARQQVDTSRAALDMQTIARAKAEGELAAYKAGLATVIKQNRPARPATQPSLMARLGEAFVGD